MLTNGLRPFATARRTARRSGPSRTPGRPGWPRRSRAALRAAAGRPRPSSMSTRTQVAPASRMRAARRCSRRAGSIEDGSWSEVSKRTRGGPALRRARGRKRARRRDRERRAAARRACAAKAGSSPCSSRRAAIGGSASWHAQGSCRASPMFPAFVSMRADTSQMRQSRRIAVERISDARASRRQVARLFLEQRKLEIRRGRPRLERMSVVGAPRGPRRRRPACGRALTLRRAASARAARCPRARSRRRTPRPRPRVERSGEGQAACRREPAGLSAGASVAAPDEQREAGDPDYPHDRQLPHPVDARRRP